jgi:hypothetical protein
MDHRKGWIWVCLKIIRIVTVNHWILGYHIFFDKTIWVVVRINNIRKKTGLKLHGSLEVIGLEKHPFWLLG